MMDGLDFQIQNIPLTPRLKIRIKNLTQPSQIMNSLNILDKKPVAHKTKQIFEDQYRISERNQLQYKQNSKPKSMIKSSIETSQYHQSLVHIRPNTVQLNLIVSNNSPGLKNNRPKFLQRRLHKKENGYTMFTNKTQSIHNSEKIIELKRSVISSDSKDITNYFQNPEYFGMRQISTEYMSPRYNSENSVKIGQFWKTQEKNELQSLHLSMSPKDQHQTKSFQTQQNINIPYKSKLFKTNRNNNYLMDYSRYKTYQIKTPIVQKKQLGFRLNDMFIGILKSQYQ